MNFSNGSNIPMGWDWPFQIDITPHIVISSIYMVIGVIGNSMVLVVYKYQIKTISDERYFIPILAVLDLTASVICSLGTIIWDLMQTNFQNLILCKCIFIFTSFMTSMSFCFLLCIAVQRYLKICRHCTLSLQFRRMMTVFSLFFSMVLCLPFGVYYGINKIEKDGNIIGKRCYRLIHPDFYISGLVYSIAFAVFIFCVVLTLLTLYGMIGWKVLNHTRSNTSTHLPKYADTREQLDDKEIGKITKVKLTSDNQMASFVMEEVSTKTESTSEAVEAKRTGGANKMLITGGLAKSLLFKKETQNFSKNKAYRRESSVDTVYSQVKHSNEGTRFTKNCKVYHNRSNKRNRRVKRNISFMFIVITFVSIISYSPLGVVAFLEGILPDFRTNLTSTESHIVLWFHRIFIINSIINPFIYAFLDTEFKEAFKRLFKK